MKKLLALVMVCVLAIFMCACGEKTEDGKTEIVIGNLPVERTEKQATWYDNTQKNIAQFQEMYPDVTVTPDAYIFNVKDFMTKAAGGDLPNMLPIAPTELKSVVENEYAKDITEYAKKYGYYDGLSDRYKQLYEYDGKWYGIMDASTVYTMGVAYNVELFKQAGLVDVAGIPIYPKTWDEFAETAKTIKEKTGKAGFAIASKNNQGGWHFLNMLWDFGSNVMKNENGKWIATFAEDGGVDALQFIKDLRWKYDVLQDELLADIQVGGRMLSTGDAGMIITQISMLDQYVEKYGLDAKNVAMSSLPAGPAGKFAQVSANINIFSVDSTDAQIEACFNWLDMLGKGVKVNDQMKEKWENSYKEKQEKKKLVGVPLSAAWNDQARIDAETEVMMKYATVDGKFFDDYVNNTEVQYRFEPERCVQQLYSTLDNVIQKVLTDESADCAALMKQAQEDFQKNYLDKETN